MVIRSRKEISLIGFVDPLDDDDDDTGVKISTDNDEYIVEMNLTGKKLLYDRRRDSGNRKGLARFEWRENIRRDKF